MNPQLERLVYTLRNPATKSAEFRNSLEEIGYLLGNNLAEQYLNTTATTITTLLNQPATQQLLDEQPVLVTLLRAGLPLYQGVQKAFPESEAGFLGHARDEHTLQSKISYSALPDLKGKTAIIADTMIATGGSIIETAQLLKEKGAKRILVIGAIASKPGIERIHRYDSTIQVLAAAIDPALNERGYIVPGLGDAGDRAYGGKQ